MEGVLRYDQERDVETDWYPGACGVSRSGCSAIASGYGVGIELFSIVHARKMVLRSASILQARRNCSKSPRLHRIASRGKTLQAQSVPPLLHATPSPLHPLPPHLPPAIKPLHLTPLLPPNRLQNRIMTRIPIPILGMKTPRPTPPVLLRRPINIPAIPQRFPRHIPLLSVRVIE